MAANGGGSGPKFFKIILFQHGTTSKDGFISFQTLFPVKMKH